MAQVYWHSYVNSVFVNTSIFRVRKLKYHNLVQARLLKLQVNSSPTTIATVSAAIIIPNNLTNSMFGNASK